MIRLIIFGKMKRMMNDFKTGNEAKKIDKIDRRLFRGLFIRKLKEFDEDY